MSDRRSISQLASHSEAKKLLANIFRYTGGMGLAGFTAGGAYQLGKWLTRPDPAEGALDPAFKDHGFTFPVAPGGGEEEEKEKKRITDGGILAKQAEDDWASWLASKTLALKDRFSGAPSLTPNFSWEGISNTLSQHPWAAPLGILGTIAGPYAGWQGAKMLGNAYRNYEQNEVLARAKKEYEKALLGQYARPYAARDFGATKQGSWGELLSGLYAAYAVPTAALTGIYAYNRHKVDNEKVLEAALKRRAMLRMLESPPELHLIPQPWKTRLEKPEKQKKQEENSLAE